MGRLFGDEGVRGMAVSELTCELAMQLGRASALVLIKKLSRKPVIFIGKDTRISSDILESALCAGICSVGADVVKLGVLPTPALAYLVKEKSADSGIMISASHNNVEFNGVTLFSADGSKLSDDIEEEIERLILDSPEEIALASGVAVGTISVYENAADEYAEHITSLAECDLSELKIAVDCANGCASETALKILEKFGAEPIMLCNEPDGTNINKECGSTHIGRLMELVTEKKCDCGIAFDGDGGRCLAVDENGELIDGDKILAVLAAEYKKKEMLKGESVVVSVLSNFGFNHFAESNGIKVVTSAVGGKYIIEKMKDSGCNLGGEQSGRIVFSDDSTVADGQLTGLRLLSVLAESGKKMSELANIMCKFPQVMMNVPISPKKKEIWKNNTEITSLIEKYEEELGENGRIIVRENGSEPMIRVMVEHKEFSRANSVAVDIAEKIKACTA